MEEFIEHFSHEHPLSLFQVDADEDPKPYRCCICGLPILSAPSYTCSVNANCNFFVHKPCAQLPKFFHHELHAETLHLEESMIPGESCRNFRYRCWDHSHCKFDLHPLVAKSVEIKSPHKSHESHPLVAFCREIMSVCDGCGEEEKGFFFYCKECDFFIHQDCTILPSVVKLPSHPHPFILAHSLPNVPSHSSRRYYYNNCSICSGEWRLPRGGVYFCGECYSLAHVACAKPSIDNDVASDVEIVHLPDEEDTFPNLAIRKFLERSHTDAETENKMMTRYHQHPLVLEDAREGACDEDNAVCDVCIQPINTRLPFYRCHDCHFLAHSICENHLPASFQLFIGTDGLEAHLHINQMKSSFNSVFPCFMCYRPCNGFSYVTKRPDNVYLLLDVECAVAPRIIKHASHKQHILFLTGSNWISMTSCKLNCCSPESYYSDIYRCVVCDYSIHIRCAMLPKTTRHKFDDHPLELIMKQQQQHDHELELFCEVCEQEIELKWWYYGCHKCEQYFHIDCIPSVGFLSKVKFGRSHVDYELHDHPLTLTRMLTHQRHERCGVCNQIIKGFSDESMAFHCSPCHFWLHFSCAAAATGLHDYSKFLEWCSTISH